MNAIYCFSLKCYISQCKLLFTHLLMALYYK